MKSKKPLRQAASAWSADAFCARIAAVVRSRFSDTAGPVDEGELKRWVELRWPVPQEALYNLVHWARAFVGERGAARQSRADDKGGDKEK